VLGFFQDRLLSLTMVLGTAFLLLVSLIVSAALAAVGSLFGAWGATAVGQGMNFIVSIFVITLLFAMIYRFLPDAKIAWRDVWFGAGFTTLLFTLGKFLIGLYLGKTGTASTYGAAGSLAALLIWLYYSAQIFLFGAELTKAYADRYGSRILPKDNAVFVGDKATATQWNTGKPVAEVGR
jgi:membrane protein